MAITEVKVKAKGSKKRKGTKHDTSDLSPDKLSPIKGGKETPRKSIKDKSESPDKITTQKSTKDAYRGTSKDKDDSDLAEGTERHRIKTGSRQKYRGDSPTKSPKTTSQNSRQIQTAKRQSEESISSSSKSTKRSSEGSEGRKQTARSSGISDGKAKEKITAGKKDQSHTTRHSRILESPESSDIQQEKILIVETLPTGVKSPSSKKGSLDSQGRRYDAPQSLVTIERFEKLVESVIQLQERFGPIKGPSLENSALLKSMHKTTTLAEPMAVLQLSARLEVAEKALEQMLTVLTDLASRNHIVVVPDTPQSADLEDTKATADKNITLIKPGKGKIPAGSGKEILTKSRDKIVERTEDQITTGSYKTKTEADNMSITSAAFSTQHSGAPGGGAEEIITDAKHKDLITYIELKNRLRELEEDLLRAIATPTARAEFSAENSSRLAKHLEVTLDKHIHLEDKMAILEEHVSHYADKVNYIDSTFSADITNYQEELAQMQHNLEISLDNMAEALANRETDADAVAELSNKFTILQMDIDKTTYMQSDLKDLENYLQMDLKSLWDQIEILKQVKSDRDEVEQALSTKVGISFLNGKVSIPQYEAVRGDLQKKVATSYEKFNNQEIIWQKHIDEVMRSLNERAEAYQVESLRSDMMEKFNMLRERLDFMLSVCGSRRTNEAQRMMLHDKPCLSCSAGATGEPDLRLAVRPQPIGATSDTEEDKFQTSGDGDGLGPCIPNMPIPHPLDRRARTCPRYCGTVLDLDLESVSSEGITSSITVQALEKQPTHVPNVHDEMRKCIPCNQIKKKIPQSVKKGVPKMYSQLVDAEGLHDDSITNVEFSGDFNKNNPKETENGAFDSKTELIEEPISNADGI